MTEEKLFRTRRDPVPFQGLLDTHGISGLLLFIRSGFSHRFPRAGADDGTQTLDDETVDFPRVSEANLHFRGMNVHVHVPLRHIDEQHGGRMASGLDDPTVGCRDRMVQQVILDESAVHEKIDLIGAGACEFRTGNESLKRRAVFLPRRPDKMILKIPAQCKGNPLRRILGGRDIHQRAALRGNRQTDSRLSQGKTGDPIQAVSLFGRFALQKLPANRDHFKDAAHANGRACRTACIGLLPDGPSLDDQSGADVRLGPAGHHFHMRNRRDAGQGLAPEAEGTDPV